MLTVDEARALVDEHLGDTPRAAHSRLAAHLMRELARSFSADPDLWEVVGLCHDLDFFRTAGNPSQHGILTVKWLGGSVPMDAQEAIASHDHRTGIEADTLLADMLKVADVIAVIDQRLGRSAIRSLEEADPYPVLRSLLSDRPYLCDILQSHVRKHSLPFARIAEIVSAAPL